MNFLYSYLAFNECYFSVYLLEDKSVNVVDTGIHDTQPMCLNRVSDLLNTNSIEHHTILSAFNELLSVEIVSESRDELLHSSHNVQNINISFLQRLTWNIRLKKIVYSQDKSKRVNCYMDEVESEDIPSKISNQLISLIIIEIECIHVIEIVIQASRDFVSDINHSIEQLNWRDVQIDLNLLCSCFEWVFSPDLINQNRMDLQTQVDIDILTNLLHKLINEIFQDELLELIQ